MRGGNNSRAVECHFMPHNQLHSLDGLSAVMSDECKSFGWSCPVGAVVERVVACGGVAACGVHARRGEGMVSEGRGKRFHRG